MIQVLFQYILICFLSGIALFEINKDKSETEVRKKNVTFTIVAVILVTIIEGLQVPHSDYALFSTYILPSLLFYSIVAGEAVFLARFLLSKRLGTLHRAVYLLAYFISLSFAVLLAFAITGSIFHAD